MRLKEIERLVLPACRKFEVKRLDVFGSVARGQEKDPRDLDFLVEFDKPRHLPSKRFFGLLHHLEDIFDRPIDLDHLFVSDFFIDQSELKGDEPVYSFLVGVRKQINPWSVLNLGLGHGFGSRDAPDLIVTLGFQLNF